MRKLLLALFLLPLLALAAACGPAHSGASHHLTPQQSAVAVGVHLLWSLGGWILGGF